MRLPDSGRAELEADPPYGLPFRPSPFRARFDFDINGVAVSQEMPVQYRYAGDLATGEKRMELNVVPGLSLHVEPSVMIVPLKVAAGVDRRKEVRVTVENNTKGAATANIGLKVPAGWRVLPAAQPVSLGAEGETTTVRFTVTPPAAPAIGQLALKAEATGAKGPDLTGCEQFTQGYQVIEYPHIQRRHKVIPAETTVKVVDVGVAPGIKLGYVMGVGDLVPQALDQLGVKVTMIDADELAYGNLAKYDTIMLGIRAYERREDLKAYNHRLIKYVNDGGTLIVQYNKTASSTRRSTARIRRWSAATASPTRRRRCRSSRRSTTPSPIRTASARTPGTAGCRSAGSTSSARRTRNTPTSSSSRIRSNTTLG